MLRAKWEEKFHIRELAFNEFSLFPPQTKDVDGSLLSSLGTFKLYYPQSFKGIEDTESILCPNKANISTYTAMNVRIH